MNEHSSFYVYLMSTFRAMSIVHSVSRCTDTMYCGQVVVIFGIHLNLRMFQKKGENLHIIMIAAAVPPAAVPVEGKPPHHGGSHETCNPARALSALGLLLSVSAPTVRWGKTFCCVGGSPPRKRP